MILSRIPRCYDSHLHLVPTAEMTDTLQLHAVTGIEDLLRLKIEPRFRRGAWVIGFGWDQHIWQGSMDRQALDSIFPDNLVSFSRQDYHAVWVNTQTLKHCGLFKKKSEFTSELSICIEFGADEFPTGVLRDRAADVVWSLIPKPNSSELKNQVLSAVRLFNLSGFTHLREMMGSADLWQALVELDQENLLTAYVEMNFHCFDFKSVDSAISEMQRLRVQESKHVKMGCAKIFIDGALGSEGALLLADYQGQMNKGLSLWSFEQTLLGLRQFFKSEVGVSVHALGDAAVDQVLRAAQQLKAENVTGALHIEHAEVLDPLTETLLEGLDVSFHLQPSHLLTDSKWLEKKLGPRAKNAFPWARLEARGIPFFFGSDSPIEPPSLLKTKQGLELSRKMGWPLLQMDWTFPHTHPDAAWGSECYSEVDENLVVQKVVFDGRTLNLSVNQ